MTSGNQMQTLKSALDNISSIQRFQDLDEQILSMVTRDPKRQDEFESRLRTLEGFKTYNLGKMKNMGLSESFVTGVSSTIPRLLAFVGESMFTLRRDYGTFGESVLKTNLKEKLVPYAHMFPSVITADYISTMVCEYMRKLL